MVPQPRLSRPVRDQIAADLKQKMFDGTLRDGTLLPSVRAIAEAWGVGHETVQQAIRQLQTEGLADVVHGVGTYAKPGRALWGPQQAMRAVRYPYGQRIEVTAADLVVPPDYVAGLLDAGQVVRREWLTYPPAGDIAVMLSVSWCPDWALNSVPALTDRRPLDDPGGAAAMVAAATRVPLSWGECAWESRPPKNDGREVPLLHLTGGEYVSATVIKWGTGDGETSTTIEYQEMVSPPGKVSEAELVP